MYMVYSNASMTARFRIFQFYRTFRHKFIFSFINNLSKANPGSNMTSGLFVVVVVTTPQNGTDKSVD